MNNIHGGVSITSWRYEFISDITETVAIVKDAVIKFLEEELKAL